MQTGADSINGNWSYTYDDFNRLNTAVSSAGQGCAETYDLYGNRLQQNTYTGACFAGQFTTSGNNNRLDQMSYDLAGNVIYDGTHHYTYDAEGRIATVDGGGTVYVYDAAGRRARKISGDTLDYVYDLGGHAISEITSSGGWNRDEVYAGGRHVATYDEVTGTTYFTHADWLGTERVRSTVGGTVYSTWTSYPFGEGSAAPNPSPIHFTGKERDTESGNDYFGARYYASSTFGRFMSPDWASDPTAVPYATYANPQSLNLYSYMLNNPLRGTDPDGHFWKALGNWLMSGRWEDSVPNAAVPASAQPQSGQQQKTKQLTGDATYYNLPGSKLAYGGKFDPNKMAAAMTPDRAKDGQTVTVTYTMTDAKGNVIKTTAIQVVVNDTGPFARNPNGTPMHPLRPDPVTIIDLTPAAFRQLTGSLRAGRVPVTVTVPNE